MNQKLNFGIIELKGDLTIRGLYVGFPDAPQLPAPPAAWLTTERRIKRRHPSASQSAIPLYPGCLVKPGMTIENAELRINPEVQKPLDCFFDGCMREAVEGRGFDKSQHWFLMGFAARDQYNRQIYIGYGEVDDYADSAFPLYAWRALTRGRLLDRFKDRFYIKMLSIRKRLGEQSQ